MPTSDLREGRESGSKQESGPQETFERPHPKEATGLFMSPDLKLVAAREVKKELTPSYERSHSLTNAVYDDINQRGACDGKYGESEFGVETREQSQKGKMSFRPLFSTPPPLPLPLRLSFLPQELRIPTRKLGRVSTPHPGWSRLESSPSLKEARYRTREYM